jgi:tRNA U34 5-carboxymethylaminomethyl modifying GTPase MnmE/TrmE
LGEVTAPKAFQHSTESFDKLYRGEPAVEGAPAPTGVPWDIRAAQPRLMELEALGGITGEVGVEAVLDVIFHEFCIGK